MKFWDVQKVLLNIMQTDTIETFWEFAQTADCVLGKVKNFCRDETNLRFRLQVTYFYNVALRILCDLRFIYSNLILCLL